MIAGMHILWDKFCLGIGHGTNAHLGILFGHWNNQANLIVLMEMKILLISK